MNKKIIKRDEIYNLYWYFASERQNIFWNKINSVKPLTTDSILLEYKFCNSYRVCDRVSQYLLNKVIYNGNDYNYEDMIFRIILFKLFNKESTWELIENEFGDVKLSNFDFDMCSKLLLNSINNGIKIYNDAYISCANKCFGYDKKHDNHLALLKKMFIYDRMQDKLVNTNNMEDGFKLLRSYPLIGNFMAYQLITDINYSNVVNYREDEFCIVGPGSKRGIDKCFISRGGYSYEEVIEYMYNNQDSEFKRLSINFKRIGNRKLQLIDCQNIFCELDKYLRVYKPEIKSNRIKIKKKYIPKSNEIEYIFPEKWNFKNI